MPKQQPTRTTTTLLFVCAFLICATSAHVAVSSIIDGTEFDDPENGSPNVRFAAGTSSPALIVTGLRDRETDYVVAEVHHKDGGKVHTRSVPLHDLGHHFFGEDSAVAGSVPPRVIAAPDYHLNASAHLRLTFWFPCDDPPTKDVGVLATPCFFDPIHPIEYLNPHAHQQQHTDGGRKTTFYVHHPAHIDATWIDVAREAHEYQTHEIRDVEKLDAYSVGDYKGATTRATCWFPEAGATKHDTMPLNLETNMHRLLLGDLHYRRPRVEPTHEHDDQRPAVGREPEVWYDTAHAKENTQAVLLDPIDRAGAPVAINKRHYCRSVVTVTLKQGAEGWSVIGGARGRSSKHRM